MSNAPYIRSSEIDSQPRDQGVGPMIVGYVGLSQRGPTCDEDGGPAVLRSPADIDRVLGLDYQGDNYTLSKMLGGGCEIRYIRAVESGTYGELVVNNSVGQPVLRLQASSFGDWSDDVSVSVSLEPGTTDRFRLAVAYSQQPQLNRTYYNLSLNPAKQEYVERIINGVDPLLRAVTLAQEGVPAVITSQPLSGGSVSDDCGEEEIVAALALLNTETDMTHVCGHWVTGAAWSAYAAYAAQRGTVLNLFHIPLLTPAQALLFRQGSGGYGADFIDSSYTAVYYGDPAVRIFGGANPTYIPEFANSNALGHVVALYAQTWRKNKPWLATAGVKRGVLADAKGVRHNVLGKPEYESLCDSQVNPIIWDRGRKQCYIADMLTAKRQQTLLQQIPIRETVNALKRRWAQVAVEVQFDPNIPSTWLALYNGMKTVLDEMAGTGGIDGFEGEGWFYTGDQFVIRRQQATYNRQEDLVNGLYRAHLGIVPPGTARQLEIGIALSATGATFSESEG